MVKSPEQIRDGADSSGALQHGRWAKSTTDRPTEGRMRFECCPAGTVASWSSGRLDRGALQNGKTRQDLPDPRTAGRATPISRAPGIREVSRQRGPGTSRPRPDTDRRRAAEVVAKPGALRKPATRDKRETGGAAADDCADATTISRGGFGKRASPSSVARVVRSGRLASLRQ